MPRLNRHAVTGQADILLCDDICLADMRLFARCNVDVTPVESRRCWKALAWVVPCSRRSWVDLLLPMVKPMPPVPIRPDFLVSLSAVVSVLVPAAMMSTLLPAERAIIAVASDRRT